MIRIALAGLDAQRADRLRRRMERDTRGNVAGKLRARKALEAVLHEVLTPGFYGRASVRLTVVDGTIGEVRRQVVRIERS